MLNDLLPITNYVWLIFDQILFKFGFLDPRKRSSHYSLQGHCDLDTNSRQIGGKNSLCTVSSWRKSYLHAQVCSRSAPCCTALRLHSCRLYPYRSGLFHWLRCIHNLASAMMTSSNGNIFPRYWPYVRGIHRWPVNSPHKGLWHGA